MTIPAWLVIVAGCIAALFGCAFCLVLGYMAGKESRTDLPEDPSRLDQLEAKRRGNGPGHL